MASEKRGFISGFVVATVLVGAVAAFSVGELYTPNPEGDWIRDSSKYAPGTPIKSTCWATFSPALPRSCSPLGSD